MIDLEIQTEKDIHYNKSRACVCIYIFIYLKSALIGLCLAKVVKYIFKNDIYIKYLFAFLSHFNIIIKILLKKKYK